MTDQGSPRASSPGSAGSAATGRSACGGHGVENSGQPASSAPTSLYDTSTSACVDESDTSSERYAPSDEPLSPAPQAAYFATDLVYRDVPTSNVVNYVRAAFATAPLTTRMLLLISGIFTAAQIAAGVVAIALHYSMHLACDKPLTVFIGLYIARVMLSYPLSMIETLLRHPPALRAARGTSGHTTPVSSSALVPQPAPAATVHGPIVIESAMPQSLALPAALGDQAVVAAPFLAHVHNPISGNYLESPHFQIPLASENTRPASENTSTRPTGENTNTRPTSRSEGTSESMPLPSSTVVSVVLRSKALLDLLSAALFVLGNHLLVTSQTCPVTSPPVWTVSVAFVVIGFLILIIPIFICGVIIFCLPCLLILVRLLHVTGVPISVAGNGLSRDQLDGLAEYVYRDDRPKSPICTEHTTDSADEQSVADSVDLTRPLVSVSEPPASPSTASRAFSGALGRMKRVSFAMFGLPRPPSAGGFHVVSNNIPSEENGGEIRPGRFL